MNNSNIGIKTDKKRTCLLVLGMHRSGTSALTRVLSLAGADLPKNLMGASDDFNPTGHWEPDALVQYHDELLLKLGSTWSDWRALDFRRLTAKQRTKIRRGIKNIIEEDYGDSSLFVIKDPRICRFAGFFIEILSKINIDTKVILATRNPLEVCKSLEKRDNISQADAALLWLRHIIEAEKATRDISRIVVRYDQLLRDWKRVYYRLQDELALSGLRAVGKIETQISEFLASDLRHYETDKKEILADPILHNWIGFTYEAILSLENNPNSKRAKSDLNKVAKNLNMSSTASHILCFPDFEAEEKKKKELVSLLVGREEKINNLDDALKKIKEQRGKLEEVANDYEKKIIEIDNSLKVQKDRTRELEKQLNRVQEEAEKTAKTHLLAQEKLTKTEHELQQTKNILSFVEKQNEDLLNSASWRATRPLRRAKTVLGNIKKFLGGSKK